MKIYIKHFLVIIVYLFASYLFGYAYAFHGPGGGVFSSGINVSFIDPNNLMKGKTVSITIKCGSIEKEKVMSVNGVFNYNPDPYNPPKQGSQFKITVVEQSGKSKSKNLTVYGFGYDFYKTNPDTFVFVSRGP